MARKYNSVFRTLSISAATVFVITLFLLRAQTGQALPVRTRAEVIATAKKLAEHTWTCQEMNRRAACLTKYKSDWQPGQKITGLPYNWGGIDSPDQFDKKLSSGLAAGSHSWNGVSKCTAGTDCSGFVAYCWGLSSHRYGTGTIRQIAAKPKYNWFSDMKPGDALNKPGSHIVLFAGYNSDGTINIYEASGSAARVIYHKSTWARLKGYGPLVYKGLADD